MKIVFSLPENFNESLSVAAQEEMNLAQRRWSVKLNDADIDRVMELSFAQLVAKVRVISGNDAWTLDDNSLEVTIRDGRADEIVFLPKDSSSIADVYVIRDNKEDWRIDDEPTANSTALVDLPERFTEEISMWLRTAVFYGVGSFR